MPDNDPQEKALTSIDYVGEQNSKQVRKYWYVVAVLGFAYAANFLDRQIINILGQSIKEEMRISDTQLGLLTGTAFALFYSLLGVPIARWADRTHRVNLISAALVVWSGFTVLCGYAQSYLQLFAARLGVGVGEAGSTPSSQSLISDYVPPVHRTLAFALFNLGLPIGSFLGFLIGGYINDWFGWRMAFVLAGAPGLLIALLLKATISEPVRGAIEDTTARPGHVLPLRKTVQQLLRLRSYVPFAMANAFAMFLVYVSSAWLPPLFIRVHGFAAHEIGRWLALCAGLGGGIGVIASGILGSTLRKRWPRGDIWLVIVAIALACPMLLVTVLSDDQSMALSAMFCLYVLIYSWMGPMSARVQEIVPVSSRSLAVGLMIFWSSITALAFGPPLVGWLSDSLAFQYGVGSLRIALAIASSAGILSALTYYFGLLYLGADLASAREPMSTNIRSTAVHD